MKKFKIILAGCGSMSHAWVKNAISREDCEIVALVDLYEQTAQKLAEEFSMQCPIFKDISEAIDATDANLVFDVTIPESHVKIVVPALKAGLNVLGEKPMASSMDEALLMLETAGKSAGSYAVMQNRRYLKNIRALKSIISSGTIGQPGFLCADFFVGPHFGGFRDVMDSPLILDMAIHTFDQARFIVGGDPVSVYCQEFNPTGSWYTGDASAVCIFEFSNGLIFCYRGSWASEGFKTSWEAEWRVMGSKGTALWDGANAPKFEVPELSSEQPFMNQHQTVVVEADWVGRESHLGGFDEMFSALLEGRDAETDCKDNIKSMAMVFAAIESSKTGKKVMIEL